MIEAFICDICDICGTCRLMSTEMRDKLRGEVQVASAAELLPHHRRQALLIVPPAVDLLDVALAIASDDADALATMIEDKRVYRPELAELADWCADLEQRLQYIILQPYVLAQVIVRATQVTQVN